MLTSVSGMYLFDIDICGEELAKMTLPIVDGRVELQRLSGDVHQLLPLITCGTLHVENTDLFYIPKILVQCNAI